MLYEKMVHQKADRQEKQTRLEELEFHLNALQREIQNIDKVGLIFVREVK